MTLSQHVNPGTVPLATTAINVTTADESTDTTCYPLFTTADTGNLPPKTGSNLAFNASSGALTATSFHGDLTGAVTGNSDTATTATNVTASANNSTAETVYPTFVDGATGSQGIETDTGLTYNPSTGIVTATAFAGSGASLTSLPAASGALTGVTSIYNAALRVGEASDGMHLSFHESGEILIYSGTEASGTKEFVFEEDGNFHADNDITSFSNSTGSDKRLKKNIKDINYGLKDILNLRGVEFDWKEKRNGKHDIGFIAQEVQEVIPEVINEIPNTNDEETKYLGVDYSRIVPILVESMKEQQKQIDSLKNEIEYLKKLIR